MYFVVCVFLILFFFGLLSSLSEVKWCLFSRLKTEDTKEESGRGGVEKTRGEEMSAQSFVKYSPNDGPHVGIVEMEFLVG